MRRFFAPRRPSAQASLELPSLTRESDTQRDASNSRAKPGSFLRRAGSKLKKLFLK